MENTTEEKELRRVETLNVTMTDDATGKILGFYQISKEKSIQPKVEYPENEMLKLFELFTKRIEFRRILKKDHYLFPSYSISPLNTSGSDSETSAENKT